MGKDDAVIGRVVVSGEVNRLIVALYQPGVKFVVKAAVEEVDKLLIVVLLLHQWSPSHPAISAPWLS